MNTTQPTPSALFDLGVARSRAHAFAALRRQKRGKLFPDGPIAAPAVSTSDTPRTDGAIVILPGCPGGMVHPDLARQLERELAEENRLVVRIQSALGTGEEGNNLVAVAYSAHTAELDLAAVLRKQEEEHLDRAAIERRCARLESALESAATELRAVRLSGYVDASTGLRSTLHWAENNARAALADDGQP